MYYEVYIDLLFLIGFMMDSLILLLTWKVIRCSTTHGFIFLGGAMGSACTCVILALPIPYKGIKLLLYYTIVNAIMIRVGLKIRFGYSFFRAYFVLYFSAFLLGGIAGWLRPFLSRGALFFCVSVLCYYIAGFALYIFRQLFRRKDCLCEVKLYTDEGSFTLRALIDTGNNLRDPYVGKPVSILEKRVLENGSSENGGIDDAFLNKTQCGVRFIPYRSVGGEGVLPVMTFPKMSVSHQEKSGMQTQWIEHPLVGISEKNVSENEEYQMILNPDILGGI